MLSFDGKEDVRRRYLGRALTLAQRLGAGEERRDVYWTNATCFTPSVCKIPGCKHQLYAEEIGVPVALAFAERQLFLCMDFGSAIHFPKRFIRALAPGISQDLLDAAVKRFVLSVLSGARHGLINYARTPQHEAALTGIINLFEQGCDDAKLWENASRAARDAQGGVEHNRIHDAREAWLESGNLACLSAQHLASMYSHPSEIKDALQWAAWPAREAYYSQLMKSVVEEEVPSDERGYFNAGLTLYSAFKWRREALAQMSKAEPRRVRMYSVFGDVLLDEIRAANPNQSAWQLGKNRIASLIGF